ncbi:hypothetical protein Tco_0979531 [Tanacetum coccineum]
MPIKVTEGWGLFSWRPPVGLSPILILRWFSRLLLPGIPFIVQRPPGQLPLYVPPSKVMPRWANHPGGVPFMCLIGLFLKGALAQTDLLERFETLQANFNELAESHAECGDLAGKLMHARLDVKHSSDLYNSLSDQFKAFRSKHKGYSRRLKASESRNKELSQVNQDQALRIKELEDTLAKKDSALVYVERLNVERAQEKEKLSHEYKQSLSGPFNLAIQVGWGKGLAEERSEEGLLKLMRRMKGFDVHADTKINVEYEKLFKR